jgi:hypothetical protein
MTSIMFSPLKHIPRLCLSVRTHLLTVTLLLLMLPLSVLSQTCPGNSDNWPGCWRPVHEAPGFHEKANHVGIEHSVHVNPFGGQLTVAAVDIALPSLMQGFSLRVRRVHNSSRLTVPAPAPNPGIHDGPLGLGWTFHYGVLLGPRLAERITLGSLDARERRRVARDFLRAQLFE